MEAMSSDGSPRRRGRPVGSVSLRPEQESLIVGLVRGGASLATAAHAAAVPARTLREWIARGEGRSSKPATRKLREFAREVRTAQAEAKASAEVRVHQRQPATWLRTEAGRAGEDDASERSGEDGPTPERIQELVRRLREAMLYVDPTETVPPCPNARCRCVFHRERTPKELEATRAMAERAGRGKRS